MKKATVYKVKYISDVRIINDGTGWWAVAGDICDHLGYSDCDKTLSEHVEDEDKDRVVILNDDGSLEKVSIITEWAAQLLHKIKQDLKEK